MVAVLAGHGRRAFFSKQEKERGNRKFTAPLTAITAAVVGVILNLALFFAYHVLWPQGWSGPFEDKAALIGISALLALFRFKVGVIPVIAVGGFHQGAAAENEQKAGKKREIGHD